MGPMVHRLAAFTEDPAGGNPAGVVVTDGPMADAQMQRIAADVGYSETAFLHTPTDERRTWQVRYFSPVAEVPFCGHATIASAVLLGDQVGVGRFTLHTSAGTVPVEVSPSPRGPVATLRSVDPAVEPADPASVAEVLAACGLSPDRLDERYPPVVASAGARHLVLVLRERRDLGQFNYDFDRVLAAMTADDLTTVAVLWPDPDGRWHARNLFPVGGVVEDPATGAAAAAFGAYLRHLGAIQAPASFEIVQGEDLGRPSLLQVTVPAERGGIDVSGTAVSLADVGAREA
jgi:PhzF family phenazine biosynthesis protein